MPKPLQGISTAEGSLNLEIKNFLKDCSFDREGKYEGYNTWKNHSGVDINNLGFEIVINSNSKYIRLFYTVYPESETKRREMNYTIHIVSVKSNLGKGNVYYFRCPITFRKCRILYLTYGSEVFKSRYAYNNRIYYCCQTYSKNWYANERYFFLKNKHEKMILSNYRKSYKGKKTRSLERIERLEDDIKYFDRLRTFDMYNALSKMKGFKNF